MGRPSETNRAKCLSVSLSVSEFMVYSAVYAAKNSINWSVLRCFVRFAYINIYLPMAVAKLNI